MPILDADLSGRLATQQDAPQKTGKIPENQCITSWDYLLSARGKEVQGPRKIIETQVDNSVVALRRAMGASFQELSTTLSYKVPEAKKTNTFIEKNISGLQNKI